MDQAEQKRFIRMCLWLVRGRWIYLVGVFAIGVFTKMVGSVNIGFNFWLMVILVALVGGSNLYYGRFFKNAGGRSKKILLTMALLPLLIDLLAITIVAHYAGGVESISFLFYIYIILAASFIYGLRGSLVFAALSTLLYTGLVVAEHLKFIPHQSRYVFTNPVFQNFEVALINSTTIAISFFIAALFAGFIADLLKKQEKRLWSEKDKIRSIIQSLADGILVLDKTGKIVQSNQQLKAFLELEDLDGDEKIKDYLKKEKSFLRYIFSVNELPQLRERGTANPIIKNFSISRPKEKFFKVISLPLKENQEVAGIIRIIRDETREKILDKIKSDFISVAAHQLRTPLASLKWGFKTLLGDTKEKLSVDQKHIIRQAQSSNERLIKLVEDLLNISSIEEGRYNFSFVPVWLDEIIEEAIAETQIMAKRESVQVVFQRGAKPLPKISLDRQKFKLALINLIDNAIKYSPENRVVVIKTEVANEKVLISVADGGLGIPEDEKGQIFSKFFRGQQAMQKESEGNGLGLFIVKNIVDEHNGKIWFASQEGRGTTFFISLPLTIIN
ncbi:MAG: hypothetical protein COU85_02430 [Candidatus Portnoybacteria bacterium CG10_big_fil_rev_8_21_14_0_10_44_7]|uniref:histidine kinase n=1 Tax=Candidatus Portnoybacteria bacterium CG10_big_fil_rev_8_21_14_0_10_44_7 TaxID=1974816 RepID=A0A2M8KIE8_9BACT|nr:MAG: hypothetical protein COU85_02430 [Candidatus Portnoybacteria bacterium CG10_big_fil_rev_8_21_14_0_10_44_7]